MMNQYHLNEAQEMEMLQRMAKEAIEIGIHEPAETLSMYMMNRGILMNQYHLNEAQKMEMFQGMAKYAIESGIHEPVKDPKQDGTLDSGLTRKTPLGSGGLSSTERNRRSKIGGMKLFNARSGTADELMVPSKPTKQNLKPQGPCLWGKMAKQHTKATHILLNGHDILHGTANTHIKAPKLAKKGAAKKHHDSSNDLGRMALKVINPIEEDKENNSEKIARSPKKENLGPLVQQNQNFENRINSDLEKVARMPNKTLEIDENSENSTSQTPEKRQNEHKVQRAKKQRNRAKQILPKNSIQSEISTIAKKNEIQRLKFLLEEKEKAISKMDKDIATINQANTKKLNDDKSQIKDLKKQLKLSAQVFGKYEDGKNEIIDLKHELNKAGYYNFNFQIRVETLMRTLTDTRKEKYDLRQEKEKLIDNARKNDVEMQGLRIGKEIAELKLSKTEHKLAEMTLEKDTIVEQKEHLARMLENRVQIENNSNIDEKCEALNKVDGEIGEPKNRVDFENLDDDEPEFYDNFSNYTDSSDSELPDVDDFLEVKIELEFPETCEEPDYGCEDPDADCKDPDNSCEVHDNGCEDPDYDNESDDFNSETCLNPCCANPDYGCEDPDVDCKEPDNGCEVHDYGFDDHDGSESDDFNSETLSEDNFSENGYNDCTYEPDEPVVVQELNMVKDEKNIQPGTICR